jgi:hypothetical protein
MIKLYKRKITPNLAHTLSKESTPMFLPKKGSQVGLPPPGIPDFLYGTYVRTNVGFCVGFAVYH